MKPPVETIRLGKQSRDQLVKIKRNTGVEHWNILCRWAFCASIREKTPPPIGRFSTENGVEMSWRVFSGEHADAFIALLMHAQASSKDHKATDTSALLHAHIRRGLGYLASGSETRSIGAFLGRWLKAPPATPNRANGRSKLASK